jgi:hypothetical protein
MNAKYQGYTPGPWTAGFTERGGEVVHAMKTQRETLCGVAGRPIGGATFDSTSAYACRRCTAAGKTHATEHAALLARVGRLEKVLRDLLDNDSPESYGDRRSRARRILAEQE